MPVPHRLLRRLLIAPIVCLVELVVLVLSPLLVVLAVLASPLFGGWRPLRMLAIVVDGVARHLAATLACFALWVASGFGWKLRTAAMQRAHYAIMSWFAAGLYNRIVSVSRVQVLLHDSDAAVAVLERDARPVIALSRHAGEGDTLLVIHQLLALYERTPQIIMHEALRLDPLVDSLGERLPNRFLDPRGGDSERHVAEMAAGLGESSALLIFPEGGNFTSARRRRGIQRLEEDDHPHEAALAREMKHVSAPRPGGTLAAISAAPDADVVVIGHTGFPNGLREVWRLLPDEQTINVRMWHVPADEIPADPDARVRWLFDCWRTLDAWVDESERSSRE
jgi:1-acyl-sn-glycerol-3-phosphate acyltransferase